MPAFNVLIPKRGYTEFVKQSLRFMDLASRGHNVVVYLIENNDEPVPYDMQYAKVEQLVETETASQPFQRGALLNFGLARMRQDASFLTILDADSLICPNFFDIVAEETGPQTHAVTLGISLAKSTQASSFDPNLTWDEGQTFAVDSSRPGGLSQFTIRLEFYRKVLEFFEISELYLRCFIGWGGEDNIVTDYFRALRHHNQCEIKMLKDMFLHIWHPHNKSSETFQKNLDLVTFHRNTMKQKYGNYRM